MKEIEFLTPYSIKPRYPLGYTIMFDDGDIAWFFSKNLAEAICKMLNGAYNLGMAQAYLWKEDKD